MENIPISHEVFLFYFGMEILGGFMVKEEERYGSMRRETRFFLFFLFCF